RGIRVCGPFSGPRYPVRLLPVVFLTVVFPLTFGVSSRRQLRKIAVHRGRALTESFIIRVVVDILGEGDGAVTEDLGGLLWCFRRARRQSHEGVPEGVEGNVLVDAGPPRYRLHMITKDVSGVGWLTLKISEHKIEFRIVRSNLFLALPVPYVQVPGLVT